MAAANTDKLRKSESNFSTTLSSSINDSDQTIPLSSTSGLPTDTAITLTIDRVDANGDATPSLTERVTGVVSGNNLTNCLRNEDSTSAQSHDSGAVVEAIWDAETWNDAVDAVLAEHGQDGTHSTDAIDAITEIASALKSGSDATLITGTAGTDGYTGKWNGDGDLVDGYEVLDEDDMSSNSNTKLATQQSIKSYVDTNASSTDGWISSSDTWTYASATSFTIAGVDRTSQLYKGTKIKLTNDGGTDYYYVASSSFSTNTTVNLVANNDYALANSAITNPAYSQAANPDDFPHWFGYDPTYTGFSVNPTADVHFRIEAGMCTLLLEINGTSNSATFNITLPIASSSVPSGSLNIPVFVLDNGTAQTTPGLLGISIAGTGSTTAKFGLDFTDRAANNYGGFTTSNAKGAEGTVVYPI